MMTHLPFSCIFVVMLSTSPSSWVATCVAPHGVSATYVQSTHAQMATNCHLNRGSERKGKEQAAMQKIAIVCRTFLIQPSRCRHIRSAGCRADAESFFSLPMTRLLDVPEDGELRIVTVGVQVRGPVERWQWRGNA